ncbi:AAA family ATPase [Azotobacter chroococcum]|uniref:sigma-54 interaction domain-containing protein n=1 Tax=Azotobacter chroococcum TaxID=353 RepID=UPI00103E4D17|nr:sigma 54-interacting transcriptional regulator [Azotobacter chroococcum]TBW10897.1 AAA family ATPase [Azotobacter chroococcum]
MAITRSDLDENGLLIGVSPERFREVAMPLLFDQLNARCEGTIAVNRQAQIVWINDKYAARLGVADPRGVLGRPVEEILPASRLRQVAQGGQPPLLDLMAFGDEHFVVTRMPLRDDRGILVGAIGFVLLDQARQLEPLIAKYSQLQNRLAAAQRELARARQARYSLAGFIGISVAASELKRQARRAAQLDATLLLRGETGTGKELLAQGIHNLSPRARGPFVALNVAAIPDSLVEAELFGTSPGAYTGAERKARIGKFELADGGTLFLDEIGDLAPPLQAKLLRVLQEQEVEPLGSNRVRRIDVRVIAATHVDLEARVAAGTFRGDLYYRLNVLSLRLPPLRERREDIRPLAEHLLDEIASRSGQPRIELDEAALELLAVQPWPGNVRELGNLLERAQLQTDGSPLDRQALLALLDGSLPARPEAAPAVSGNMPAIPPLARSLANAERAALLAALAACNGNRRRAAQCLGIARASLYNKLQQHGLNKR